MDKKFSRAQMSGAIAFFLLAAAFFVSGVAHWFITTDHLNRAAEVVAQIQALWMVLLGVQSWMFAIAFTYIANESYKLSRGDIAFITTFLLPAPLAIWMIGGTPAPSYLSGKLLIASFACIAVSFLAWKIFPYPTAAANGK